RERLNHWLTLVQRGEVLTSYRVFLGLMQDVPNRRHVLAHLAFAGLIDVQDRMWHNRSYTTGHKGYRARATIELGEAIGWDNAHHVRLVLRCLRAPAPAEASLRGRALHQPRLRAPGQHAGERPADDRAAGGLGSMVVAPAPREAGAGAARPSGRGVGGPDRGLPE